MPDFSYLFTLKAGPILDLELHVSNYWEPGVRAAISEVFRLAGRRLRMLDLRLWIPNRSQYYNDGPPIVEMLTDFDVVIDCIQEFRLYGSETCLNDDTLSALVGCLSMAPNLRRFSLGKVGTRHVKNFRPLGNLSQLEWLYLSACPKLNDAQFLDITGRLVQLKRLWLLELPFVTNSAIMTVIHRLEAFEISKCYSFSHRKFMEQFLEQRTKLHQADGAVAEAALALDRLEFVKIRGCSRSDLHFLSRLVARYENLGIRVLINNAHHEAIFILKNHEKWRDVDSIRLSWYNCQFCNADLST